MLDCAGSDYGLLYARWQEHPETLLDWTGYDPKRDSLLDLCGGAGVLSRHAWKRGGKRVVLFDKALRYLDFEDDEHFKQVEGDARDGRSLLRLQEKFDLIVCRQAIGYLDLRILAQYLPALLSPRGRFVFNTFVKPKWAFNRYRFQGRPYLEASGYFGQDVWHVQAGRCSWQDLKKWKLEWSWFFGFDVTRFRWHRREELLRILGASMILTNERLTEKSIWMEWALRGSSRGRDLRLV
jgi:hypothetical protein